MKSVATAMAARLLAAVAVVSFAAGCAATRFPLPDESSRINDPATLLERIASRRDRILNVSTTGRISSKSPQGLLAGRLTTAVTRGGLVRLDAWTPTWDLVGSFVGDPEGFVYFQRGEGLCHIGESTAAVITSLLPIGLDYDSMSRLLAGSPPVVDAPEWRIEWDRRAGSWLLSGHGTDGAAQKIWADADGVTRRVVVTGSGSSLDIHFEDFVQAGDERMASRISISSGKQTTTVNFKEIDVNTGVTPDDFLQECPEGARIVNIGLPR